MTITTQGPFGLQVEELDKLFYIACKNSTRRLAIPLTAKNTYDLPWHKKEIPPADLWKMVSTEQERADTRMLCKAAEMYEIIRDMASQRLDCRDLVKYIEEGDK